MPFEVSWTALGDEGAIARAQADALLDDFADAAAAASRNTSERAATKLANRHDAAWHFVPDPPILSTVPEDTVTDVIDAFPEYLASLQRSQQRLALRYRPHDVAQRIVGTGSVGMRSYVVLLQGNGDEALVLQFKQAGPSALAPYLEPEPEPHDGKRIVLGARLVQAETDPFYGWTTVAGLPFTVRQFRNRKGSIDVTGLAPGHLDDYGRLAGALLARAHSRTIDPRILAAYLDDGNDFDSAIERFAVGYATRVEVDYAQLVEAISAGRVPATPDPAG